MTEPRRFKRIMPIAKLLKAHPLLQASCAHAQETPDVLERVRALLPAAVAEHCLEARLNQDTLTLFLDSPAWTTRVRFLADEMQRALRMPGVAHIQVRTTLSAHRSDQHPKPRQMRTLSARAAEHLRAAANDMTDPDLAAALRRLASRHRPEH